MDRQTLAAYDTNAVAFADEWHDQPAPSDLHAIVKRFFHRGLTADVGCGSGRDVAWLAASGYPAIGYDPSPALLAQARARYPQLDFELAALPDLAGLPDGGFENVLCETVIMHLSREQIAPAVRRLLTVVRPGGMLYLNWRVTAGSDQRDARGRLYVAFDAELVRGALNDATIVLDEAASSASSGKKIHRMVARRNNLA